MRSPRGRDFIIAFIKRENDFAATVGTAVNLIFPGVPLALAVGCSMAALTGALLPAPFMISLVVLLVTGINSLEAIPVLLAGILSHAIVAGFGLIKPPPAKKPANQQSS